jgi:hypothetical protein
MARARAWKLGTSRTMAMLLAIWRDELRALRNSATPAYCIRAAIADCSKASGMTTIGTPAASESSTLFIPPWQTVSETCSSTASCGTQS